MLLSILASIERIIKDKLEISDSNTKKIIELFKNYKKGMWIYPGILKRKFGLSISDAYMVLQALEKEGIVKGYYELYCGHCQKSNGTVHVFNELPETFECELCHEELMSMENAVLIYKVIMDE